MASGSYRQVYVVCPYYVTDNGRDRIVCEGLTPRPFTRSGRTTPCRWSCSAAGITGAARYAPRWMRSIGKMNRETRGAAAPLLSYAVVG